MGFYCIASKVLKRCCFLLKAINETLLLLTLALLLVSRQLYTRRVWFTRKYSTTLTDVIRDCIIIRGGVVTHLPQVKSTKS